MSAGRGPRSLGDELRRLSERLGGRGHATGMAASAAWDSIVGPEIAKHTTVMGVRKGELLIGVDSPAWAGELGMMAEELQERIESATGESLVGGLRFTVTREVERARAKEMEEEATASGYGGPAVTPAELTEDEIRTVRETVAAIEDEGLRDAAFKAILKDLQWKKALRDESAP